MWGVGVGGGRTTGRDGDDGTALVELECMRGSGQLFKNKKQVVAHSGHPQIYRLAILVPSKQVNEFGLQDTPSQGRKVRQDLEEEPGFVTRGTWPAGSAARCELLIYMSLPSPP